MNNVRDTIRGFDIFYGHLTPNLQETREILQSKTGYLPPGYGSHTEQLNKLKNRHTDLQIANIASVFLFSASMFAQVGFVIATDVFIWPWGITNITLALAFMVANLSLTYTELKVNKIVKEKKLLPVESGENNNELASPAAVTAPVPATTETDKDENDTALPFPEQEFRAEEGAKIERELNNGIYAGLPGAENPWDSQAS